MDPLRLLLDAAGANGASPKESIQRRLVLGALAALLALAWAVVLVALIALTAMLALEPELGAATAAAITAGGFVVVGLIAVLMLRGGERHDTPAPAAASAPSGLAGNGDMLKVHNAWDVATLVALGVLTGLQQRKQ